MTVSANPCWVAGHSHERPTYGCPEHLRSLLGGATGRGVRIAVIDSGWDRSLACPMVTHGIGVVSDDSPFAVGLSDDQDRVGHGTAVADVIFRIAPEVEIVPVRVFCNRLETSLSVLAAGLQAAGRSGAELVNLSLGTLLVRAQERLREHCRELADAGTYVVAAGDHRGFASFPAALDTAIGVEGAEIAAPYDLEYRPGERVELVATARHGAVVGLGGERGDRNTTSFAVPVVTGICALLIERYRPCSIDELRKLLMKVAAARDRSVGPSSGSGSHGAHHPSS